MEFQHAKMTFMMELDNYIRYYRSGVLKVQQNERDAINQLIRFMNACKQLNMALIEEEKNNLKTAIGNLLYDSLESGNLSSKFSSIWTKTNHQSNMFYNKSWLLCEFMSGDINGDIYEEEEQKEQNDMNERIQSNYSIEILVNP